MIILTSARIASSVSTGGTVAPTCGNAGVISSHVKWLLTSLPSIHLSACPLLGISHAPGFTRYGSKHPSATESQQSWNSPNDASESYPSPSRSILSFYNKI